MGFSHTAIEKRLHALGKSNRSGKWIPHELSEENKATRVITAGILLKLAKKGSFLDSIVTSDEKWIFYDNRTRKRQWLSTNEDPKPTPKPDIHSKKTLLCVWWSSRGLVHFEVLKSRQTVNSELYSSQLHRVDQAIRSQGLEPSSIHFLHDNAKSHTAKLTMEKIEELGWNVLPHAPYSPDMGPSDYHLFRSMQHFLAEKKFNDLDEVRISVQKFFDDQPEEFFKRGIQLLRQKWKEVIKNDGEYLLD